MRCHGHRGTVATGITIFYICNGPGRSMELLPYCDECIGIIRKFIARGDDRWTLLEEVFEDEEGGSD